MLLNEFQDAVILKRVRRIETEQSGVRDSSSAAQYAADAERFLSVTAGMAECEWSVEDHAWLRLRQRSVLNRTASGREALKDFEDAPILMDTRRKTMRQDDGADQVNQAELLRVAEREKIPILG